MERKTEEEIVEMTHFAVRAYERTGPLWDQYLNIRALRWNEDEVSLKGDKEDWVSLNKEEQNFLKHVLSFFANADGLVNANLTENFMREVDEKAALFFYAEQIAMENVHSIMYAQLIENLVPTVEEQNALFLSVLHMPAVQRKMQWAQKWKDPAVATYPERLLAYILVEGVMFSASFAAIRWVNHHHKKLPGLAKSNEFISRDEHLHCKFGCTMYKRLSEKLPKERVLEIVHEAVECELSFVDEALPTSLRGMDAESMKHHVKFCANAILCEIDHPVLYKDALQSPFKWMKDWSLEGKGNFFEERISEYAKADHAVDEGTFEPTLDF